MVKVYRHTRVRYTFQIRIFYHMTRNHLPFILSSLRTRRGWLELEVGCRLGSGGQSPRLRCHDFARPVSRGRASHKGTPYRLCEWVLSRTGELVSVSRATNARSDTPVDRFDGPHTALVPVRTFFSNLPGALWSGASGVGGDRCTSCVDRERFVSLAPSRFMSYGVTSG